MHIGIGFHMRKPGGRTLAQRIAALFAAGEQGAWFDCSDLSTLFQDSAGTTPVTAVSQPVGKMLDKSGRGNHATQATATARPTLQQDVNGKYYLAFDGIDDHLNVADVAGMRQLNMSFFIGIDPLTLGAREDWFSSGSSDSYATNNYIIGNSATSLQFFPRTPAAIQTFGALQADVKKVVTITADGTNIYPRINGISGSSSAAVLGTDNTNGVFIGCSKSGINPSYFSNIRLYSLIIRGALSDSTQISNAESYINSKTLAY